jgi:hypothetical protein
MNLAGHFVGSNQALIYGPGDIEGASRQDVPHSSVFSRPSHLCSPALLMCVPHISVGMFCVVADVRLWLFLPLLSHPPSLTHLLTRSLTHSLRNNMQPSHADMTTGHRGLDGKYYVLDYGRTFPPEAPSKGPARTRFVLLKPMDSCLW